MNWTCSRAWHLALGAVLLAMPVLAIATLTNRMRQAGMYDPYIYTALLHDPMQVLARYGSTYYANRVAFTVPAGAAVAWLGDAGGHFLFEAAYLLAATLSGFVLGRRYFSTAVGIAAAAWVAFNPWLINALAWDYTEGASVCALVVAVCCFGLNGKRPLLLHAAGGVAFALAVNANQFAGAMAMAFAPAWLILNRSRGVVYCLGCVAMALAAFVIGYAGLMLVEYRQLPALGFGRELVSFHTGVNLLHGDAAVWYQAVSGYLAKGNIYILMPAFLAAGLVILIAARQAAGRRIDRFTGAATINLVLTAGTYLLFHYYFRTAILTIHLYDGYAFSAGLLAIIGLIGATTQALSARARTVVCAVAALCFALLWIGYAAWQSVLTVLTAGMFAAVASVLVALMAANRAPVLRAAGAVLGACLAIAVFYFSPDPAPRVIPQANVTKIETEANHYASLHNPAWRAPDNDLYAGTVFLQHVIAKTLPVSAGPVGFWYGDRPEDTPFNSMQFAFLWAYSRIVSGPLPDKPGVHLDAELRQKMAQYSYIAILSRTEESANHALQALGADGALARLHARFTFPGEWFGFVITIVDYVPPSGPVGALVAEIPVGDLTPLNGASVTAADGGRELRTVPQRWVYSASIPLPRDLPQGKLVLRVRLRVLRGQVGVLATSDPLSPLLVESGAGPTVVPHDVDLAVPDGAAAHFLIIRNWAPFGLSDVMVSGIEVFRAPP